jgi:hypothetical protein
MVLMAITSYLDQILWNGRFQYHKIMSGAGCVGGQRFNLIRPGFQQCFSVLQTTQNNTSSMVSTVSGFDVTLICCGLPGWLNYWTPLEYREHPITSPILTLYQHRGLQFSFGMKSQIISFLPKPTNSSIPPFLRWWMRRSAWRLIRRHLVFAGIASFNTVTVQPVIPNNTIGESNFSFGVQPCFSRGLQYIQYQRDFVCNKPFSREPSRYYVFTSSGIIKLNKSCVDSPRFWWRPHRP